MSSNRITTTILIDNMTCVNCENIIEQELAGTVGIESVTANYSRGTATVTYDTSVISLEKMIQILEKSDYHVTSEKAEKSETTLNAQEVMKTQKVMKIEQASTKSKDYTNVLAVGIIIFSFYMVANRFGLLSIFNSFPIAKDGMGYGMLFLIGVLTSVHCVAMCGGICLSQCVPQKSATARESKFSAIRPSLLYNLGRVISYTIIGGIVGAIGSVVSFSGAMKGLVQVLAGVFMVIMGLNMLNIFPWLRKFNPRMPKIFAKKIYAQKSSNSPLYIGILNGLMPCGPLQAMQLYALSTGSPIKGALSMFLFSIGTVPLMFAFGALSSFLSKKFTTKMMTASAVLVIILGVFMFNSGVGLSGISLPTGPLTTSSAQSGNVASIKDGVQTVTTSLSSGRYEPITVQKGIPVKWIIQAEAGDINGCNNSIVVPKYKLKKDLATGDNIIEFTPNESGIVPFSCWMGMIRSKITVVDDLGDIVDNVDNGDKDIEYNDSSSNEGDTNASGLENYNNLLDVQIPTDELAIATVIDGIQSVEITFDETGFFPAVVVLQSGLETVWTINGSNLGSDNSSILFPYYQARLDVFEGENSVNLYPDLDFDFFSADKSFYGYVKVVDDINDISKEAIKDEVSQYRPAFQNNDGLGVGAGLPSCH